MIGVVTVGMTFVITSGGIDLSVGAIVAIGGAFGCLYVSKQTDQNSVTATLIAVAIALVAGVLLGAWNGFLVARIGIQPYIAHTSPLDIRLTA